MTDVDDGDVDLCCSSSECSAVHCTWRSCHCTQRRLCLGISSLCGNFDNLLHSYPLTVLCYCAY